MRPFDWEGRSYRKGEHVSIDNEHPRIGGMVRSRFIRYDPVEADTPERPVAEEQPGIAGPETPRQPDVGVEFHPRS